MGPEVQHADMLRWAREEVKQGFAGRPALHAVLGEHDVLLFLASALLVSMSLLVV